MIELTAAWLTDVSSKSAAIIPGSSGFSYDQASYNLEFVINGAPFTSNALSGVK